MAQMVLGVGMIRYEGNLSVPQLQFRENWNADPLLADSGFGGSINIQDILYYV